MPDAYTIEPHPHGIIVRGTLPLSDFDALDALAKPRGYDIIDTGIASSLDALLVLTNREHAAAWRAEIEAGLAQRAPLDRWLAGTDTGVSSLTLAWALTDVDRRGGWGSSTPSDPDDFGRCVRLLEAVPGLRERLPEAAEKLPDWRGLIEAWAELEELWRSDQHPRLYARMQEVAR